MGRRAGPATTLWEQVDEGTPLFCNPRKVAPGMEISNIAMLLLVQLLTAYFLIYTVGERLNFNRKNVTLALKTARPTGQLRNEPGKLEDPGHAWVEWKMQF